MKLETVPCDTLSFDPANLRKHGKKNIDAIKASLRRFGQQKPIVVDAKGIVLAGNGTLAAAQELGWKEIQIVRTDLSGTQATAFGIADNRSAELAEWDEKLGDVLASLKAEDFPLEDIGFDAADLEELAPEAAGSDVDAEPQIDKAEELRAKWGVELGQVWQLGEHRLACGDSTKKEQVDALLVGERLDLLLTDPPYCSGGFQEAGRVRGSIGTSRIGEDGKSYTPRIANDALSSRGYSALIKSVVSLWSPSFSYVFTDWRMWTTLFDVMESCGFGVRSMLVWDKGTHGMGRGWLSQHELIMFAAMAKTEFTMKNSKGNVLMNKRSGNELHPTQKPVELLTCILEVSDFCSTVGDPFAGSGTTIIACERTGRKCRAIELNPGFVAVAIQRWADATGKEPKKL